MSAHSVECIDSALQPPMLHPEMVRKAASVKNSDELGTTRVVASVSRLRGVGKRLFPYPIYSAYDDTYPNEMLGEGAARRVSAESFALQMERINTVLVDYFPCLLSQNIAYGCCLCTAGISLLCPFVCMSEVKMMLLEELRAANDRPEFYDAGVSWHLVTKATTSWIEVRISHS